MKKFRIEEDFQQDDSEDQLHEHLRLVVDPGQAPLRIDKYLFNRVEKISRNRIQQAADAGFILVNDEQVKSNYKVRPADEIVVLWPEPKLEYDVQPEAIPLAIVYEDDHILLVDKPAGMVVHPGSGNYHGTLVNGLLHYLNQLPVLHNQPFRPGLVHRIDKNTSGLLVIAKDEAAMYGLARQFSEHSIRRTYMALVWGNFKQEQGTITGNIGRSLKNRKMMDVFPDGDFGKPAITHYRILENLHYVSVVECQLETGRTHQIRVHMKYIHHPLFNDETYGGDKILKGTVYARYRQFVENCFALLPGQALHAKTLGFSHPVTGVKMEFETPLPESFSQLLDKWRAYTASSLKAE